MTPRSTDDDTASSDPTAGGVPAALLDELYGLPLDEFVAARDAAARSARPDDRPLARRIAALSKPTVAAWVVNQAARTVPHAVDAVAAIGDELRAASATGDRERLVALDKERRRVLDAVLAGVADTVRPGGRAASEATLRSVRDTFVAAVADPGAAAAVRAGHLARGLEHVGFGLVDEAGEPVELDTAPLEPPAPRRPGKEAGRTGPASPDDEAEPEADAAAQADADRAVDDAAAELDRAEEALDDARTAQARAQQAAAEAADALERAHTTVADLEADLARARDEQEELAAAATHAHDALSGLDDDVARLEDEVATAEENATAARRRRRAGRRAP
ncbi:hypothetical protein ACFT5B_01640 [Luteimicrobium sp. NPDC057192]|uniref:hypothetical protein n=1 Tax=Luteimicrobium sp. NPDC057192 TaxID=3346042 RepID=UPI003633334A